MPSPGPLYQEEWVQKLLQQIRDFLQTNSDWLGIDQSKRQRVLDYAAGNGTVSSVSYLLDRSTPLTDKALLTRFSSTVFQGIDIATSQVERFNSEATQRLGPHHERMFAIQGDLTNPHEGLDAPEWFGFDVAIISMALHHVRNPIDLLTRLRQRVKRGGVLVVVDFLRQSASTTGHEGQKYNAEDMSKLADGMKIWPGFSVSDIRDDMSAAGCVDFELREYPEVVNVPGEMHVCNRMFIARATVC